MKGTENWTWSTWAAKEGEKIDRAERSRPDVVPRGWTSLDIFSSCTTEVCKIAYSVERRNKKRWLAAVCQCWEEPVRANTSLCTPQLLLCSVCKCLPLAEMGCWGHRLLLRVRQKKILIFLWATSYLIIDHIEKNQIPCQEQQEMKDVYQPIHAHRRLHLYLSLLQQSWMRSTYIR